MNLHGKPLSLVTEKDILQLIENEVPEGRDLDYKRDINLDDRKEFLFDLTSFANTTGGIIIYGVEEKKDTNSKNTGTIGKLTGIGQINEDQLKQQINSIVADGINPNLTPLQFKFLKVQDVQILLIGISQNFGLPHMVVLNRTNKFYRRNTSGKYLMDVIELNTAFLQTASYREKAELFRQTRLAEIEEFKNLIIRDCDNYITLHIVPISSLGNPIIDFSRRDIVSLLSDNLAWNDSSGRDQSFNVDGYRLHHYPNKRYIQLFRDGCIEEFRSEHFGSEREKLIFYINYFESHVIKQTLDHVNLYSRLNIPPPFIVMVSVINIKSRKLYTDHPIHSKSIENNNLLLPPTIIYDSDCDIERHFKSTFDIIWQAAGLQKCMNYDESGNRIPNRNRS
ncbi:MAG: ATP-binding protein [Bacteroidetes bacterium]|nr:ATP-binding protein [Bacteroidota bacterium]MBK9540839.1 ATP-binding protein [Bacteroidota bacterium]